MPLAVHLEHARLHHRARRLQAVLRALDDRDRLYVEGGAPRPPLQAAIRDFRRELAEVRARLTQLEAASRRDGIAELEAA